MNMMDSAYKSSTVEALVLASPEPLSTRKIAQVIEEMTPSEVAKAIAGLNERYAEAGISFRIREIAGGYQFYILPEYVGFVEELFSRRRKLRLTRAALETAAIIAYRQPVTKGDIEHIRGVASDGVLHNLVDKKLVSIVGRADTVGKPLQYGTTDDFLKFFGLNSIKDLPKMAEIEELVAAAEPRDQTELTLVRAGEEELVKLNVADGTFDPATREDAADTSAELIPIEALESEASEPLVEDEADEDEMIPIESGLLSVDEDLQDDPADDQTKLTDEAEPVTDDEETDDLAANAAVANRLAANSSIPQGTHGAVGPAEAAEESSPALSVATGDLPNTEADEDLS